MTRDRQIGTSAKNKPSERWKEEPMECPALALLHWLRRGENTKGTGQTECDSRRQLLFPTSAFQRHIPLCFARVQTRAYWKYCFDSDRPQSLPPLIQWFPGVQQLHEYKRDSLILSKVWRRGEPPPLRHPPRSLFGIILQSVLALAATMPYSSLCQWNNTASVAMDRAQQQLSAYADIAACEADASVFLHANYAFFKFQNRDSACEWTGTGASFCRLMFWRRQRYKNPRETHTQRRWAPPLERQGGLIRNGTILTDYTTRLLAVKIIED